ncbi:MAG TPA: methylmalonyl Co-A mutase-associated GTPase MeaB [Bryobacteraceae bacterium]|nr:methylmalonyl Co-A mutase-associated GTPase MeaB [Bryobacteraceae bacterium]
MAELVEIAELTKTVLRGDLRALARAATLMEDQNQSAATLLAALRAHAGRALILGITGAPGAGKSTLCDRMISLLRAEGKTVGVIAVDPSSPLTGGAILGDRIRMQQHHADPGVFIRSMATRGIAGGIARATADLATLLDAAGRDVVIIETVGIGQSEVEISRLAQVTILVMVPGSGDDVQAMKAGVLEVADIFVINKADLPGTDKIEQELHSVADDRPVLRTVASEGQGIAEVLQAARSCKRAVHMPPEIGASLDHLGIAVRSLDQALQFYEAQLGLHVAMRQPVVQEKVNVAMLPLGEPRIELLEPTEPDSVIAKFIEKRGEGLHHVALKVPDLSNAVERLRSAGARIMNDPRPGAGGHLYVFVHPASTGGILLELIQA